MFVVRLQCTRQPCLLFISAKSGFVVVKTKPFAVLMVYVQVTIEFFIPPVSSPTCSHHGYILKNKMTESILKNKQLSNQKERIG